MTSPPADRPPDDLTEADTDHPAGHRHSHGHGHAQGHDGGGAGPVGVAAARRVRRALLAVLVPLVLLTAGGVVALWPDADRLPTTIRTQAPGSTQDEAVLTADPSLGADGGLEATARTDGGLDVTVLLPPERAGTLVSGDRVVVSTLVTGASGRADVVTLFVDVVRGPPMAVLLGVLAVLVVLVARWRGFAALVGVGLSLAGLLVFTIPALLTGRPAVPVALVSGVAIMTVVLYLTHGVSVRTSTALLGTVAGLVVTAAVAVWATGATHLDGLSGEESLELLSAAPEVRLRAVLVCGMVLAGLGVLNDVTITQASAVWELHAARPRASGRELFSAGMRIGRDHIASTVYTIVFAYVGASLTLVLLVSLTDRSLLGVVTSGQVAEEVVRTLVGSIGLVLAIPLTTALGAWLVRAGAREAPVA